MSSRRPGIALLLPALALFLGLASEGWAQQLVSGGNFSDRTAHNQALHQGDTIQALDVFYSCVGADLAGPTINFNIPAGLHVSFDTANHVAPVANWDFSGGISPTQVTGGPVYDATTPTKDRKSVV